MKIHLVIVKIQMRHIVFTIPPTTPAPDWHILSLRKYSTKMDEKKKQTKRGVIGSTKQGNQWPQNMVACWSQIKDREFSNF